MHACRCANHTVQNKCPELGTSLVLLPMGRVATVFTVTGDVVLVQADVGVGVMPIQASDDALMVALEAEIAPLAKAFTARLVFQSSRLSLEILATLGTHCS